MEITSCNTNIVQLKVFIYFDDSNYCCCYCCNTNIVQLKVTAIDTRLMKQAEGCNTNIVQLKEVNLILCWYYTGSCNTNIVQLKVSIK